ncbi:MAG: hypothetical protein ABIQ03_07700 [Burkholderiales bacterium]
MYSSVIGNATGYGLMCADIANVSRPSEAAAITDANVADSSIYRLVAAWRLFSPLIWSFPGMPGFVAVALIANAATVVVLPLLCASLWYITARTAYIGPVYRNGYWENSLMAGLFALSVWGAYQSVISIAAAFHSSL